MPSPAGPDAAEAAMRTHLREILNDLPAIAASRPDSSTQRGAHGRAQSFSNRRKTC